MNVIVFLSQNNQSALDVARTNHHLDVAALIEEYIDDEESGSV